MAKALGAARGSAHSLEALIQSAEKGMVVSGAEVSDTELAGKTAAGQEERADDLDVEEQAEAAEVADKDGGDEGECSPA